MKPIRTARHFEILCLGAILWFLPASPSFAQGDLAQFLKRNPSTPATVSKNQLLAPAKAMRALERARKEIHDGHLESAQKEITCALNIAPHLAIAKALQGAIDLETQNFEEATTFFQQALQDDPALGAAYLGMATILIHQGRSQAALPLLDRADGLLPGAWLVHFVKAWAQLETGNVEAALKQADYAERAAGADSEQIRCFVLASHGIRPHERFGCCTSPPGIG